MSAASAAGKPMPDDEAGDREQAVQRLYRAGRLPELVQVPELSFLMLDGRGDPSVSDRFRDAVQALFGVSYRLRFARKRAGGVNYRIGPLEGLFVSEPPRDRSVWQWTLVIRQSADLTQAQVLEAAAELAATKQLPTALQLRLERFAEGHAAQILHLGPYTEERPTIERLHAFIADQGYKPAGRHHEIYLGDPRRSAPERLKTIIRQPVG